MRSENSMKINEEKTVAVVTAIICDRCNVKIRAGELGFSEMIQIYHSCGYGSVWEDGATVEADFCDACLKDVIGECCRVRLSVHCQTDSLEMCCA